MKPIHIGPDLLDLLAERVQQDRPELCKHAPGPRGNHGLGWTLEVNPDSAYVGKWVHADASCRLPSYDVRSR